MRTENLTDGTPTEITFAVSECSLGAVLIARTARGLSAVLFADDADALTAEFQDRHPHARPARNRRQRVPRLGGQSDRFHRRAARRLR